MTVLTYKTTFMTKMSAYASKPFSLKGYKRKINLHISRKLWKSRVIGMNYRHGWRVQEFSSALKCEWNMYSIRCHTNTKTSWAWPLQNEAGPAKFKVSN